MVAISVMSVKNYGEISLGGRNYLLLTLMDSILVFGPQTFFGRMARMISAKQSKCL